MGLRGEIAALVIATILALWVGHELAWVLGWLR